MRHACQSAVTETIYE